MTALIVPFERVHLIALEARPLEHAAFGALGSVEDVAALCDAGSYAYSVLSDRRPVACIGVTEMWHGVATAWAFLGTDAAKYFKTIHRGVWTFLRGAPFHRIQTAVRFDHVAGHRWALHLGFVPECVLRQYGPDRADFVSYARCSDDRN